MGGCTWTVLILKGSIRLIFSSRNLAGILYAVAFFSAGESSPLRYGGGVNFINYFEVRFFQMSKRV